MRSVNVSRLSPVSCLCFDALTANCMLILSSCYNFLFPRLSPRKVVHRTDGNLRLMFFASRSIPAFPTPLRRVIGHHWPWYRLPGPMAFLGADGARLLSLPACGESGLGRASPRLHAPFHLESCPGPRQRAILGCVDCKLTQNLAKGRARSAGNTNGCPCRQISRAAPDNLAIRSKLRGSGGRAAKAAWIDSGDAQPSHVRIAAGLKDGAQSRYRCHIGRAHTTC
jgi:hypothetical protein